MKRQNYLRHLFIHLSPLSTPHALTRLKPLTSIRGIAAFWVYLYHCQFFHSDNKYFTTFAGAGYYGVDIFFILSGFILCHVHKREFMTLDGVKANSRRFLSLRLGRIYPLHLVTLVLVAVLLWTGFIGLGGTGNTPLQFVYNLLLIQALPFAEHFSFNFIAWSISVEWLLYLAFPLFIWGIISRAKSTSVNLLIIALCFGAYLWHGETVDSMFVPGKNIFRGAFGFVIGAALYNLFQFRSFANLPWDFIGLGCVAAIAASLCLRAQGTTVPESLILLSFAIWIFALSNIRGFSLRFYSHPAVVYLGTISYSLYMTQFILGVIVFQHGMDFVGDGSFASWRFIVVTAGFLAVAAFSYHFIESPIRHYLRKRVKAELQAQALVMEPETRKAIHHLLRTLIHCAGTRVDNHAIFLEYKKIPDGQNTSRFLSRYGLGLSTENGFILNTAAIALADDTSQDDA